MTTFDNQGVQEQIPDYKRAVKTDKELTNVISKIGALMADRGFPLKDLSATISGIEQREAEERLVTSKAGSTIAESLLDKIRLLHKPTNCCSSRNRSSINGCRDSSIVRGGYRFEYG